MGKEGAVIPEDGTYIRQFGREIIPKIAHTSVIFG